VTNDFEKVEDAIIERLRDQVPTLRTVETYAGQLEVDLRRLPFRLPAGFVLYGGSDYSPVDGPNHLERAFFTVYLAARSLRGQEDARKGDEGAYALVKAVLKALVNRNFGLPIEALRPMALRLQMATETLVLYALDLQTEFDTQYSWPGEG
jgi:phage gp37-like protein